MLDVCNVSKSRNNLLIAEKSLKEFKGEFPYLKSNSKLVLKSDYFANKVDKSILDKLLKFKFNISTQLFIFRTKYKKSSDKIPFLKSFMKKEKIANCKECSIVMFDKLKDHNPQNVVMRVYDGKSLKELSNHCFTVIGLNSNDNIKKPSHWNKNAVIVDAWSNLFGKKQPMLDYYKQLFKVDKDKYCKFDKYISQ